MDENLPARPRSEDELRSVVGLALLLACVLVLRLVGLYFNRTDLFFDEAQYWSWSRSLDFGYYSKPPLIAWIIRVTTSVCGQGEACVRSATPILHTVTAWLIYLSGQRLYGTRAGVWSAAAYVLLPGVSFSAALISTDAPLLTCWAAALLAFIHHLQAAKNDWRPAAGLGFAIGLGLNAKYAMAFFLVCAGLFLFDQPERRPLLRDRRILAVLGIAALMIAPNIVWNAHNGFATFDHTADNTGWGKALIHPARMFEFLFSQFAVFGPVFFLVLLLAVWRAMRSGLPEGDRLLLWLTLPVIATITMQAFISRAHANWAAPAYIAATPLVVAHLLDSAQGRRWLDISMALHGVAAALLGIAFATAGAWKLPVKLDPMARVLGWRELGRSLAGELERARIAQRPYRAIMTDERAMTASLLYYLRDEPTPVVAWRPPGTRPRDHFELTRPYHPDVGDPILLVSLGPTGIGVLERFASTQQLVPIVTPAGSGIFRTYYLFSLAGFRNR